MSDNLKLRKLPALGELPTLGDPTKGYANDSKSKNKSRSRSRSKK